MKREIKFNEILTHKRTMVVDAPDEMSEDDFRKVCVEVEEAANADGDLKKAFGAHKVDLVKTDDPDYDNPDEVEYELTMYRELDEAHPDAGDDDDFDEDCEHCPHRDECGGFDDMLGFLLGITDADGSILNLPGFGSYE